MEVNAVIVKNLNQIRIKKKGVWADTLMSIADAKRAWERGLIKKHNNAFARLVDFDFDVKKTIEHYKAVREEQKRRWTV